MEIELTFTEFEILLLLAQNVGEIRISDMNNVQQASACQGVFYIFKTFSKSWRVFDGLLTPNWDME